MSRIRLVLCAAVLLAVAFFALRPTVSRLVAPVASRSVDRHGAVPAELARASDAANALSAADPVLTRQLTLERLAYTQAWDAPQFPTLMAFRDWAERFRAVPSDQRRALAAEGVELARARRPDMLRLIQRDPQRALAATVPAALRQILPAAVLAELETRVSGTGDYTLIAKVYAPGEHGPAQRRVVYLGGVTYDVHPYGRREEQLTKDGASLHGIALDGHLALHESPLRVLEPGEIPATAAAEKCPVSSEVVPPLTPNSGVNIVSLDVVEALGRVWEFCGGDSMLEQFEAKLIAAEEGAGPRVGRVVSEPDDVTATPAIAREASSAQTVGIKPVLVIRVDFSDIPGEPITVATAQAMMDNNVSPFFDNMSYGKTSLVTTVSSKVYRLPKTANAYATADEDVPMHADARLLAAADYTLANFERLILIFPNIGSSRVPGSKVTYAGSATVNGANIWINGPNAFTLPTVSHELGHTYGLHHANLWKVSDGNALSPLGTSLEYGDPFDTLGSGSVTGVSRDERHHFNPWSKNRVGWLPDSAVKNITISGTYRVFRFDAKGASPTQPLALRIFRDGVRNYWIGLRQNFATGSQSANDAYIIWGYNNRQRSELLDLNTPGVDANDATLPIGSTLVDPTYGIRIKPIARGGADPAQWLDVEITVPSGPPNVVTAWGREGVYFFNGNDLPTTPAPETYVPMGLINVRSIAAGEIHAVALKSDGSVVSWGDDFYGQSAVPAGLGTVVEIAAGRNVSGAVKADGTIRLWGDSTSPVITSLPANLTGIRKLALGYDHALALKADGTIVAWGSNANGQSTVPSGLADVTAIAAGDRHSTALKSDGTVAKWGASFAVSFPAGLSGVTALSSNGGHTLALKNDGTVVAWGNNGNGQSSVPAGLSGVVAIAAGAFHSLALKSDGSITGWGSTVGAKLNIPGSLTRAATLVAGANASYALAGPPLALTEQPQSYTMGVGGNVTLTATASGAGVITYQWSKDGVPIPGATNASYSINGAHGGNTGQYTVTISDSSRSLTSTAATVTVNPTAPISDSRLYAISCRAVVGTGADVLIPGITVGGSGSRQVIVRAKGPSIQDVSDTLARPKLELYNVNTNTKVAENIGWDTGTSTNTDALRAAFIEANLLPLFASGSADSALLATVEAGVSYTAVASGVASTTGVSVVEVYEIGNSAARVIALSCRAKVGTGDNILIPGIIIAGSSPKSVIIRASGPALAAQGVPGTLAQLQLQLYNSDGIKLAENIGWSTAANLTGLTVGTAASGLPPFPLGSADCAIFATLPPGGYTAQVSGLNNTTGVALIEIYEVP